MTVPDRIVPATRRAARAARAAGNAAVDVEPVPARARENVRWSRQHRVVSVFAAFAALGLAAAYVGPMGAAIAEPVPASSSLYASAVDSAQSIQPLDEAAKVSLQREGYAVYVKPTPTPTPTATESGGTTALYTGGGSKTEWLRAAGIAESDWGYVDYIVKHESGWNPNATNASSGACGLVQALPCSKVPGNGYDPVDNLKWADGYAKGRYGSWGAAYAFWTSNHWW
ncbi:MAG: transglycosylase SLT domain-containing protein [Microbacterium sp.]|uniref:aggregation-promoting factor C-terminal-like domain-containing protein n=1 Tax=Microbacterium sp. TaxID=51671 RepID=UPI0039E300FA